MADPKFTDPLHADDGYDEAVRMPEQDSLKARGKQGAAGAPPQDEPSAEESIARDREAEAMAGPDDADPAV